MYGTLIEYANTYNFKIIPYCTSFNLEKKKPIYLLKDNRRCNHRPRDGHIYIGPDTGLDIGQETVLDMDTDIGLQIYLNIDLRLETVLDTGADIDACKYIG
jgi:hypothetical protein